MSEPRRLPTRRLGPGAPEVSVVGYGAWPLSDSAERPSEADAIGSNLEFPIGTPFTTTREAADKIVLAGDRTAPFNVFCVELWRKGFVGGIGAGPLAAAAGRVQQPRAR